MTKTTPRWLAVLGFFLLGLGTTASAQDAGPSPPSALNDRAARSHLEAMEKYGVLRDPFWAHAYWARAHRAPSEVARVSDLRWALRFDPDFTVARGELCRVLLLQRDPEFATQLLTLVSRGATSFLAQQRALTRVFTIGTAALVAVLVLLSVIAVGKSIPATRHGLWERLHFLPPDLRNGGVVLTMLAPFVLVLTLAPTAALFWGILLGAGGTWTLLDRRERRTIGWALASILLAPFVLALWTRITEPALPGSHLRNLWMAQASAAPVHPAILLRDSPAELRDDPDFHASLALFDRRQERYEEAAARLERALALRPGEWSYLNNLGNIRLLMGDPAGALESYERAIALAPDEPLPHVNRAQAFVQLLKFNEANLALERATELGYRIPPVLSTSSADVVVRDRVLDSGKMWIRFLKGEGLDAALTWRRAAAMIIAPVFPMRPFWISLPLFLALWYATRTRTSPRVFACAACGRSVCRKCHYRILRKSLCTECFAIRQEEKAPLKREALIAERRRRVERLPRTAGLALSVVLPGSGLLLGGRSRLAVGLLAGALAVALTALAGVLWPDPAPALSDGVSVGRFVLPAVLFALLSWVSALSYRRGAGGARSAGPPAPRTRSR